MFHNGKQMLKYKTKEILGILKENRAKHEKDYNEALEVFTRINAEVKAFVKKVKAENEGVELEVSLDKPKTFVRNYDHVIRMFELCTEEIVELDGNTFSQYVMDEWEWSREFNVSTMNYTRKV